MNNALKLSGSMVDAEFGETVDLEVPRYEIWLSLDDSDNNSIYSVKVGNSFYDDPENAVKGAEEIFKTLTKDVLKRYPDAVSMTLTVDEVVDCEGEEMTVGSIFSKSLKK